MSRNPITARLIKAGFLAPSPMHIRRPPSSALWRAGASIASFRVTHKVSLVFKVCPPQAPLSDTNGERRAGRLNSAGGQPKIQTPRKPEWRPCDGRRRGMTDLGSIRTFLRGGVPAFEAQSAGPNAAVSFVLITRRSRGSRDGWPPSYMGNTWPVW